MPLSLINLGLALGFQISIHNLKLTVKNFHGRVEPSNTIWNVQWNFKSKIIL